MKRKLCIMIVGAFSAATLLIGCGEQKDEGVKSAPSSENVDVTDESEPEGKEAPEDLEEPEEPKEATTVSIQDEIAEVEEKSVAKDEEINDSMTQTEMNINAADKYKIWDDELNSLWDRLTEELDEKRKEQVLEEQRQWITKKEHAVAVAGVEAFGGSMQPLLESCTAADITRARVYVLAGYLAEVRGESFVISDEIAAELAIADPDLDTVFASFEGQWFFDENRGAVVCVEKFEDSAFLAEDFEGNPTWVVWVTGGDVLTDTDVYSYSSDAITFQKGDAFYELKYNMEGKVQLAFGYALEAMDDVIVCD